MAKLIDGKKIAADVKAAVKTRCDALKARGVQPSLAVILVGEDPASQVYVRNKARACTECGILNGSFFNLCYSVGNTNYYRGT